MRSNNNPWRSFFGEANRLYNEIVPRSQEKAESEIEAMRAAGIPDENICVYVGWWDDPLPGFTLAGYVESGVIYEHKK